MAELKPTEIVRRPGTSLRHAAVIAASGLLVMSVLSPVGYFYIFPKLIVRADVVQTIGNIAAHQGLFLTGICCFLVTFIADIVVGWALYVFLRPVNAAVSLLTAWFRLAYATMALVSLLKPVTALRLSRSPEFATSFGADQLHAQVQLLLLSFRYDWSFSLLVFALHLGMLAYLVYRSGYVPKLVGVLLAITSAGYMVDSLRAYLFPDVTVPYLFVAFFGELIFMVWLFVRGSRLEDPKHAPTV
ncbi:MAG TPA: DUF4386 domain-containing protein [Candidatus Eisenbacteria bacterium]|jgi:hypothetical protein